MTLASGHTLRKELQTGGVVRTLGNSGHIKDAAYSSLRLVFIEVKGFKVAFFPTQWSSSKSFKTSA